MVDVENPGLISTPLRNFDRIDYQSLRKIFSSLSRLSYY